MCVDISISPYYLSFPPLLPLHFFSDGTQKHFLSSLHHLTQSFSIESDYTAKRKSEQAAERNFFAVGSEVSSLLLTCASKMREKKKLLTLLQMWHMLVLSILGYEVKVEELGKKVRTSRKLQLCKSFNEAKVEKKRITSTDIEC